MFFTNINEFLIIIKREYSTRTLIKFHNFINDTRQKQEVVIMRDYFKNVMQLLIVLFYYLANMLTFAIVFLSFNLFPFIQNRLCPGYVF